ncbi:MAG: preprotein translocase subunit YajC [Deltaproteobacteria bacterium]|nr:preprotein translocase subunit YajC [Deltaproteobacteria bacterium]MBW2071984.1 preprotein translocase subunit YajC [Deltaproteobacteria bacterium]
MDLMGVAYAMGTGGAGGAQGGGFAALVPLLLMFGIFYFLLIRPQQKKQKQHRALLANLKKGDMVITSGGLHGRITGLTDTVVTLEIAEKVRVKVGRGYIANLVSTEQESKNSKK